MLQNKCWQNKISKDNALKVSVLKKKTGRKNLRPNFRWFCYERTEKGADFFKRHVSSTLSYGEKFADLRLAD
jgi:hypothetical protein